MLIFPNLFPKAIGIDRGFRNPIAPAIPIDMPHTKPIEIPICDSIGYRPLCGPYEAINVSMVKRWASPRYYTVDPM